MERWDCKIHKNVKDEKIDLFLKDIVEISKKHKLSLSHEDHHGSFVIQEYNNDNIDWLLNAAKDIKDK